VIPQICQLGELCRHFPKLIEFKKPFFEKYTKAAANNFNMPINTVEEDTKIFIKAIDSLSKEVKIKTLSFLHDVQLLRNLSVHAKYPAKVKETIHTWLDSLYANLVHLETLSLAIDNICDEEIYNLFKVNLNKVRLKWYY